MGEILAETLRDGDVAASLEARTFVILSLHLRRGVSFLNVASRHLLTRLLVHEPANVFSLNELEIIRHRVRLLGNGDGVLRLALLDLLGGFGFHGRVVPSRLLFLALRHLEDELRVARDCKEPGIALGRRLKRRLVDGEEQERVTNEWTGRVDLDLDKLSFLVRVGLVPLVRTLHVDTFESAAMALMANGCACMRTAKWT